MTEHESNEKLFALVNNTENWKLPTIPYKTDNYIIAQAVVNAIIYYQGGAKISTIGVNGKEYTVSSEVVTQ